METRRFLLEILENCYPVANLYATDMKIINGSKVIVSFFFPTYTRAKRSIPYTSANQIVPAVLEGLYVAAGNYVKNENNKLIQFHYEELPVKMWSAIFREFEHFVFSQKIPSETITEITFEIKKVEEIKDFFIFYFKFFGPVRGEAKCLIPR
ncbi:MAG: hypothetical protein EOM88_02810 [Clostridia bacterium]|nr:hypothetical protein [Clostridia bacterium]